MIGTVKVVRASVFEVRAKRDGVGRRAVSREPDDQDVASSRNRRNVDRSCRIRTAVDDPGVALRSPKRQRNRAAERLRRGRHIDWRAGAKRDAAGSHRGPTRAHRQATRHAGPVGRHGQAPSSHRSPTSRDR